MITIKKLKTLKPGTLRRKTAVLLQAFEDNLNAGSNIDMVYLKELTEIIIENFSDSYEVVKHAELFTEGMSQIQDEMLLRKINSLRHEILKVLGAEPADWDMNTARSPVTEVPDCINTAEHNSILMSAEIYLDDIRSPFNIGSIFRTAEAFGVSRILLSPDCPSPDHPRAKRSSMGCTDLVAWERVSKEELFGQRKTEGASIFALELGGTDLSAFKFPKKGIAVIGSEELGISPEARSAAAEGSGLVSIPVYGCKGSINVSVAFGIMMQRWSENLF